MSFVVTTQGGATFFFISPSACLFNCKLNDVTFHPGLAEQPLLSRVSFVKSDAGSALNPADGLM